MNLRHVLLKLDEFIRSINLEKVSDAYEAEFLKMIHPLADCRKRTTETNEECLLRLQTEGKRFLEIYKNRGSM